MLIKSFKYKARYLKIFFKIFLTVVVFFKKKNYEMSELINLSETSSNDTLSVISNEDNEGEDNDNREEDNDNREEDNNNRGAADNDEGETSKERPITSDVWDFVNRKTRKCPSCEKIFEKKTGTS